MADRRPRITIKESDIQVGLTYRAVLPIGNFVRRSDTLVCLQSTDTSANFLNQRTNNKFGCRRDSLIGSLEFVPDGSNVRIAIAASKESLRSDCKNGQDFILLLKETRVDFNLVDGIELEETAYIEMAAARATAMKDDEVFGDLF